METNLCTAKQITTNKEWKGKKVYMSWHESHIYVASSSMSSKKTLPARIAAINNIPQRQRLYTTSKMPEIRRQRRGQRSGGLPCKWSLTWQLSSHFPLALGTIWAVTKEAGKRLIVSVRWLRSSSVFPWKKTEWMSSSLPMPNKCQATGWLRHSWIPGRLPNT